MWLEEDLTITDFKYGEEPWIEKFGQLLEAENGKKMNMITFILANETLQTLASRSLRQ